MPSKIRFSSEIPTHIGFIFLLFFGLVAALVTIRIGDKIIKDAPDSKVFNANRQLQQEVNNSK